MDDEFPVFGCQFHVGLPVFGQCQQECDSEEDSDVEEDEGERFGDEGLFDSFARQPDVGDGSWIDAMLDFVDEVFYDDDYPGAFDSACGASSAAAREHHCEEQEQCRRIVPEFIV